MYHRILVPLDGSPLAEVALPHAAAVARRFEASITLIQVVSITPVATSVSPLAGSGTEAILAMEALEASEEAARDYLGQVAKRPELEGIPVQVEVARGSPAQEIIRRAHQGDIDLIVMSTHGRSGLVRLVFGSVADQVLRQAGVPILLIRPKQEAG